MDRIKELRRQMEQETFEKAQEYFKPGDTVTVPLIQRYCSSGYHSASGAYQMLLDEGFTEEIKKGISKVR